MAKIKITEIVDFNPNRPLKRGMVAPFVDMAALPVNARDIIEIGSREYTGNGAKFKNGDTLFSRITPCLENGKTAKVSALADDIIAHGSTEFIVLAAKDPKYDEDFVYYVARLPEFRAFAIARMEGTSGRQRVSWQALSDFEYSFPDKEERKEIGALLKTIDDQIFVSHQINLKVEKMAQAIFKSWFVHFEPVRARTAAIEAGEDPILASMRCISGKNKADLDAMKILDSHSYDELRKIANLFPDALIESELGLIPEGWTISNVGEILELAYGKGLKELNRNEGNIPVYGSGGVTGSHNDYLVQGPGIIVGRKGTVGSIYYEGGNFFPIDTVFYVIPRNNIPLSYCYFTLRNLKLNTMNTDAAVPGLNRRNVYRLRIPTVPTSLILIFDKYVNGLMKLMSMQKETTLVLANLRDILLPELISGNLPIHHN
jgi:type I restriction enzyme S subunit